MKMHDLTRLFWDVDSNSLALLTEKKVIARILSHGTFAEIKELRATHNLALIQEVFLDLKPGALSARRRSYFSLIFS